MDSIDLRSDTVTWPTPAMREAIAAAEVGDDVYGDDPTVNRLEALAAERLGKEAALFVASGTMGNLIAILTHCTAGDAMIAGRVAHAFMNEAGGAAALGGVHTQTVPVQPDGTLALDNIRAAVNDPHNDHHPLTRLVEVENTQGALGGIPLTPEYVRSVRAVCDDYGLKLHLDGARIWNAATALGCDVAELASPADSVMFCLSKGLCAPVGSMLCGPADFIRRAHRVRKRLGGGMRQAGVLAAAGIIAIEQMTGRLAEDHANAFRLAEGLAGIDGIEIDVGRVKTNMVFFRLADGQSFDAAALVAALRDNHDVKINPPRGGNFRFVTHYWITPERVDTAVEAIREEMARLV